MRIARGKKSTASDIGAIAVFRDQLIELTTAERQATRDAAGGVIMVDELRVWSHAKPPFRSGSCHLTTDGPIAGLHAFAARIGMKLEWFQPHPLADHYDLTDSRRELALRCGAVFVPAKEQARARIAARNAK